MLTTKGIGTNEKLEKSLLIFAGIVLIPIGLSYGIVPEISLTGLYGFSVDTLNLKHIFRGQMGLCIGQTALYFLGAFQPKFRQLALGALVAFMLGLAAGRCISIVVDGIPHWALTFSAIAEIVMGLIGLRLLLREYR